MLFKVTHIDQSGHRRRALVAARSWGEADDQMTREFGEHQVLSCVRLSRNQVEQLVRHARNQERRPACVS